MAGDKMVDRSPRFLPIVLDAQMFAGSFEYALDYLIDTEIDLSGIAKFVRELDEEVFAMAERIERLVPLLTWVLNTLFRAKARLFLANPHTFAFLVQTPLLDPQGNQIAPRQTVHTRSLMV